MDELLISEVYMQSVPGNYFIEEEQQRMVNRAFIIYSECTNTPDFYFGEYHHPSIMLLL